MLLIQGQGVNTNWYRTLVSNKLFFKIWWEVRWIQEWIAQNNQKVKSLVDIQKLYHVLWLCLGQWEEVRTLPATIMYVYHQWHTSEWVPVMTICVLWCEHKFMDCSLAGSPVHGISQARLTGCHFLLQGIILTQGSNPSLLNWRWSRVFQVDYLLTNPPGKSNDTSEMHKFRNYY